MNGYRVGPLRRDNSSWNRELSIITISLAPLPGGYEKGCGIELNSSLR